jgi:glutamine phosphoribosylpyrophosphate amidotransferase
MCAVIGSLVKYADTRCKFLLTNLFKESVIRGQESFGYYVVTNHGILWDNNAPSIRIRQIIQALEDNTVILIHCRYSTSGNTGQPIVIDNNGLIFNGNIHMGTKEEIEHEFKIKMKTDNDGEVFLTYLTSRKHIQILNDPDVSFFGAWYIGGCLYAARNKRRPGYIYREQGNTYLVSTKDILSKAGGDTLKAVALPNGHEILVGRRC